jgi:hypothetical protein
MSTIFRNGNAVIVNAKGAGKLHLLSYSSNSGVTNHVGYIETTASGLTRFVISFSYTFTRFAFYWEGTGEAVYGAGDSLARYPIATSWDNAIVVEWGSSSFTSGDVQAEVKKTVVRNNSVTAFIIPEL